MEARWVDWLKTHGAVKGFLDLRACSSALSTPGEGGGGGRREREEGGREDMLNTL